MISSILLRKNFIILIILLVFNYFNLNAQTNTIRKNQTEQTISRETRIASAQFSDGIKEFYSNNFTAAETIFREVLNNNPKNDAAYYMLAKVRVSMNDFSGALPYLINAIKINNKNIWYELELANVYEKVGDLINAEKSWKKVCENVNNNEYYYYSLATVCLKNEKYEEAIDAFNKMEEIIGFNEDLTETKKNIWIYLNQVEKAANEYKKWIEMYPYEIDNYLTVANIYFINGMNEQAFTTLKQCESIDSTNIEVLSTYIDFYKTLKNNNEVEKYSTKLYSQKDQNNEIFKKLKEEIKPLFKKMNKEKIEKGIELVKKYCNINPENGEGFGLLSQLYFWNGDDQKSLEFSSIAIENKDFSFETWNINISLLYKNEKYNEIISKSGEIETLFSTQSFVLSLVGYSYYKTGDHKKAIEWFKNCLIYSYEDSLSAQISEVIGDIYSDDKNKSEALKYWKMSQKYGNNSEKLIEKIKQIQ
jgi:tetratricopeptide (TPR) repeat protein